MGRTTPTPQDFLALNAAACAGRDGGALRRGLLAGAVAYAQTLPASQSVPLISGLGEDSLRITTDDPMAQAYFDQGLRLILNFNHAAAVRSFRAAQQADPACAMCYWGEALALGPNINAPMAAEAVAPAYAAAQAALARIEGVSPVERALIEAVQARYAAEPPEDRSALDRAFAQAMRAAADAHPQVDLVQALAIEAMMDTQPWAYWEADGRTPAGYTEEALGRLEGVLARNPLHAPSIHLYIHLTEASENPWRAASAAERLDALGLASGHLQHMPAHTYMRVGRFRDVIEANVKAVAADEAFLRQAPDDSIYRYGYYPHNLHFVLTGAQMGGDAGLALETADKLDAALPQAFAEKVPWVIPIKAAPWFARAQFASSDALLSDPGPGEGAHPYLLAAWRYARGAGFAKLSDAAAARQEAGAIAALAQSEAIQAADGSGVPASTVLKIAELSLLGRAAVAAGRPGEAIEPLAEAAELQAKLPYSEPPWWPYPVRRSLAAAMLADGQAARAEQELMQALIESPRDAYAYWLLAKARAARGDRAGSRAAMQFFKGAWLGGRARPTLDQV